MLAPLLRTLDRQLDRRLVVTFVETLQALLVWRHDSLGLLLSELGSYLAAPGHAPAGTKRLSNLLRSKNWQPDLIAQCLWDQAVQHSLCSDDSSWLVGRVEIDPTTVGLKDVRQGIYAVWRCQLWSYCCGIMSVASSCVRYFRTAVTTPVRHHIATEEVADQAIYLAHIQQ